MSNLKTTLTVLVFAFPLAAQATDKISFNRDIRPILSDKCYFCHGPDSENRQADLQLDSAEDAAGVIESGELIRRILSDDPDETMPPPEAKLTVSDDDVEKLKAWIKAGAEYESHWAFEPLREAVPVPETEVDDWSKETLDRFVRASLDDRGLQPTGEAAPMRWLRRVTFDLIGLPPTLEEIDAFQKLIAEQPDREQVYQSVVDRLLQSPAYGEHMAAPWLDAARYADSYGYQSDRLNTQWPYRDWVVRAFNDNLPYDDFLTWQLAGDLLESPTRDQLLATAFNRLHRLNNEGGAVFEEWRIESVADRVHTFGTAILGLTMECCRCHDHKYDPISMRDYYSLSAYFNSIDENGVYDNSEKVPAPFLLLPTDEQAAKLEAARQAVDYAESEYAKVVADAASRFEDWNPIASPAELPDQIRALSFDRAYDESLKEISYPGAGDANLTKPLQMVAVENSSLPRLMPQQADDRPVVGDGEQPKNPERHALRLDGERGVVMPGIEPFDRWTPFSVVVSMQATQRAAERSVIVQCSRGQLAFNGWDLILIDGHLELRMYRVWPGNAIGVHTIKQIPLNEWLQVSATYDGSSRAAGMRIFVNGEELETEIIRDQIIKRASVKVMHGGKLTIGQRFRGRGLAGGLIDDFRVFGRALTPPELKSLASGQPIVPTEIYYVNAVDMQARAAFARLTTAREEYVMAEEVMHAIPVMDELDEPREAHVLARGAYDAPTNEETRVSRRTFERIGPEFPADAPNDRLGLARWVTSPNHPLTSRVMVNRLWANFFGHGLVRSPDNFGLQGELPTHPELLDWLARDFAANGWDVKRFCRNVVLSATYRQDSRKSAELAVQDPDNRWLARGPAYRLSAEQIRDLALASSRLLTNRLGGPPVSPYQPGKDLWRESNSMSPAYQQSVGQDLYRRSLYSVWKRTAPLPNMIAFDAGTREVCTAERTRTNTPLQALVLMNDVQFVEAARALAQSSLEQHEELASQVEAAFQKLTGRSPSEQEGKVLTALFADERAYYAENTAEAAKLIELGEAPIKQTVEPADLAAMTVVCQAIFNLDATVWKR
jgi:hypothetical protein